MESITEIITFTRSAFRPSDFDKVEQVLIAREANLKNECDLLEKKHGEEVYERVKMEKELERLMKELRDKDDTILRMAKENAELKNMFKELDRRILHLEKEVPTLASEIPLLQKNGSQKADLNPFDVACGNESPSRKQPVSGKKAANFQMENIIEIDDSDDEDNVGYGTKSVPNALASDFTGPASNMHKRKQASEIEFGCDDDDDSAPIGKMMKQEFATDVAEVGPTKQELASEVSKASIRRCDENPKARRNLQLVATSSDSDEGSDSGDENCSDSYIENMIADLQRQKEKREWDWTFEVNMKKAFEKDDELCMNAVCALYRQRNSINNQRINTFDARRIITLAELLIDGDPQRRMKKCFSELKKADPNIVDECRKLALLYSKHLFEIFQKKKDPFFPDPNKGHHPTKILSS